MDYERSDDLPEFTEYHDEGCKLIPSCLNCPYPLCIYDVPERSRALIMENRNTEILRRFRQGEKMSEIAAALDISRRTVGRIVKKFEIRISKLETNSKHQY